MKREHQYLLITLTLMVSLLLVTCYSVYDFNIKVQNHFDTPIYEHTGLSSTNLSINTQIFQDIDQNQYRIRLWMAPGQQLTVVILLELGHYYDMEPPQPEVITDQPREFTGSIKLRAIGIREFNGTISEAPDDEEFGMYIFQSPLAQYDASRFDLYQSYRVQLLINFTAILLGLSLIVTGLNWQWKKREHSGNRNDPLNEWLVVLFAFGLFFIQFFMFIFVNNSKLSDDTSFFISTIMILGVGSGIIYQKGKMQTSPKEITRRHLRYFVAAWLISALVTYLLLSSILLFWIIVPIAGYYRLLQSTCRNLWEIGAIFYFSMYIVAQSIFFYAFSFYPYSSPVSPTPLIISAAIFTILSLTFLLIYTSRIKLQEKNPLSAVLLLLPNWFIYVLIDFILWIFSGPEILIG